MTTNDDIFLPESTGFPQFQEFALTIDDEHPA